MIPPQHDAAYGLCRSKISIEHVRSPMSLNEDPSLKNNSLLAPRLILEFGCFVMCLNTEWDLLSDVVGCYMLFVAKKKVGSKAHIIIHFQIRCENVGTHIYRFI